MKRRIEFSLSLIFLLFLTSCGTTHLTSKISDSKRDTFRNESFLRYTKSQLAKLEDSPYGALAKCHEGKIEEGLKELQSQIKKRKKEAEFWNQVGVCYFLKENLIKAEYYFQYSLDMTRKKNFAPALNNLGTIKLKQGHYQMALEYFQKAAKRTKLKVPLFNQAQVYLQFNLLERAQSILEAFHSEGRKDPDILIGLGSVYLLQGKTKESLEILASIPDEFQDREDITLMRALSLYQEKRINEVYQLLKDYRFIDYVPLKRSAHKLRSLVLIEKKKLEDKERKEKEKKEKMGIE